MINFLHFIRITRSRKRLMRDQIMNIALNEKNNHEYGVHVSSLLHSAESFSNNKFYYYLLTDFYIAFLPTSDKISQKIFVRF